MSRLIVTEFVSLDGVMEDPGGAEEFEHGGWALQIDRGPEGDAFKLDETRDAAAMLLGRRTYEGFAAAWPGRTDDVGFAEKMNSMPKYVVSSTLQRPEWTNSAVVSGDLPRAVADIKGQIEGDILVAGSAQLVQGLARHDLVDEYRLMVFPTVLGKGKRLFPDGRPQATLKLTDCRPVGPDGVAVMVYEPVR
jgi:dihydrofolate reductase